MTVFLPISTVVAGVLGLWLVILSGNVIRLRQASGVSLGTGEDRRLTRAVRAQGNLTEYAPMFVVLLVLAELQGGNAIVLACLGAVFLAGRLGHGVALGFTEKWALGRLGGMIASFTALGLVALYALGLSLT
ncbi:MAG: MAPEG family protein [Pseudomonadota bacterium]